MQLRGTNRPSLSLFYFLVHSPLFLIFHFFLFFSLLPFSFSLSSFFLLFFSFLSVHLWDAELRVCVHASGCSRGSEEVSEEKVGGKIEAIAFFMLNPKIPLSRLSILADLRCMLSGNLDRNVVRFYEGGVDLAPVRISPLFT